MGLDTAFFASHFPNEVAPDRPVVQIPPALPPRPIQWRRCWEVFVSLYRDTSQTEKVFELFDAAGGPGDEGIFQTFIAHADGMRLLSEKPSLIDALADHASLAAMPAESFGRRYLSFAQRNQFAADGIQQADLKSSGPSNAMVDPHRRWFFDRVGTMHDLWHVLTDYETDEAGEASLLAFSLGHGLVNRTFWLLVVAAAIIAPKRDGFAFQRHLIQAYRRGRAATALFAQPYETLLPKPFEAVRQQLGIIPPQLAHPKGLFRGSREAGGLQRVEFQG